MASSSNPPMSATGTVKKSLLDLPSETIALIFENATDHDLAQLCRVSKAIRELAAAELYHNLNHTFTEDVVSAKPSVDYLAGFLETLATSDYNYAAHVKDVYVDTGYAASKGEAACRQYGYDLTCGKFLNTLLLATLKRTTSLEGFHWNARIELSTKVYLELHRMPNLRRVHIRLPAGPSLHSSPKSSSGAHQSGASLNASPISPGVPPPPGPHSPGGYGYSQPNPPSNTFRVVQKLPVTKLVSQPCSFSGFKNLKSLCALDMDTLEYIPEIAECVRNSLDTLKQLELSLSDSFGRKAREKPRVDGSDGATSDDASSVASQPVNTGDEGAPSGSNPEQMRQWYKARHEAILSRIFAPKSPSPNAKVIETAANEIVTRAESEARHEPDAEGVDSTKEDEDREFVKMMRAIFRGARSKQEPSSRTLEVVEKIEKAATKYLEGHSKSVQQIKTKAKNKSSLIKIKTPKPPPPNTWSIPHPSGSNYKSYSVNEDMLLDYFGFSKGAWDNMAPMTKNQYLQTYFKETQGVGYQPYSMPPPPPPGKSQGHKMFYATSTSVPSYGSPSKYIVVPPKKTKKAAPAKPKYNSDSDDEGKAIKPVKSVASDVSPVKDTITNPTTKKEKGDISEDTDMLFPSDEEEEEGPDQQFNSDDEASNDEAKQTKSEMEQLKEGINGVLKESGFLEEDEEAPVVINKGKQAVRDPPNGHLIPPKPSPSEKVATPDTATVSEEAEEKQEDPISKYLRLSHGLPVERLAIYLVPVKATTFLQHFDPYALKSLTLLNVGSQRRIWATLTKMQRQSPLPLTSIYTDNVSPALLTFIESLEAGQLEDLLLLERYLRKKGRVPQLQDCDRTSVEIDAIRKQILKKHVKGLKRLMIRNDDSESWAINNTTMRLIAREGSNLRELAVQCDTISFHTIIRSLPTLTLLYALQINFILDAGTPPVSMTGMAVASTAHHYGGAGSGVIEPHTSASATMLHELRQAVIDGMSFCKDTTQLEWLGFSWLAGGSRHQSHLDGEGNPYVFLSRVVREVEVESCSEDEDGNGNGNGDVAVVEGGGGKGREGGRRRGGEEQISLWAENDLNISEVQGVRMWDKEIWAGRL